MNLLKIILLVSLIINNCLADDAKYLIQGTPAPFTGFLISSEKAEKIRLMDIDLSLSNKTNELLTKENTLINEQLTRANTHIDNLSKQLVETRDTSMFSKLGLFLLGAGAATLITFGVSRATR